MVWTKEYISQYNKEYRKKNIERIKDQQKKYCNSPEIHKRTR